MSIFTKGEKNQSQDQTNSADTLGSRIAELRKKIPLTQEELAERLGVTAQAVSKWENDASCPDIMLLPQIAKILGTSIDELMGVKSRENAQKEEQETVAVDTGKLKLRINITDNRGKPLKMSVPVAFVLRAAKLGIKISAVTGNEALNGVPFDKISELVKNGVTGEVFDMTTDDGTHINIEIS